ncbi:MAG TPA: cbb3-type cytochrome c oxidase subunit II [Verrucomicrobiae bacterium]|nr:cbb3-type cytochrome c oxidase subunit II [Verrucomicrobiae bacterium]
MGTFFAMSASWLGFVLAPQLQLGNQAREESKVGDLYPSMRPGIARQGEQIYRANGCFYCHSQQVRPKGYGTDFERGWGGRHGVVQSVDEDYLYDEPAMLGTQRIGPDLANVGLRIGTNEAPILQHIYDPRSTMPGSLMPPYQYLFKKHKLGFNEHPSDDALPADKNTPAGYEIIPTENAHALVAYLMSLRSDAVLFETPPFPPPAKPKSASTNAPAAAATTNSAAK